MPHLPDLSSHAGHDPELVAAYAAGDATGDALDRATALVAGCAECGELHRDLRAIATATAVLPAPVRPRDFRLTPEQAASLRPAGLRGLLATLAGPRFGFAAPLGSAMATLGLVGILVAGGGLPLGAGGATSGDTAFMAAPAPTAGPTVASDVAGGPGASVPALTVPQAAASAAPATEAPAEDSKAPAATPGMDTSAIDTTPAPSASSARDAYAPPTAATQPTAAPPGGPGTGPESGGAANGGAGTSPPSGAELERLAADPSTTVVDVETASAAPLVAAITLLVGGLLLVGLRLGSRRLAR
jgi:hypothetical protein